MKVDEIFNVPQKFLNAGLLYAAVQQLGFTAWSCNGWADSLSNPVLAFIVVMYSFGSRKQNGHHKFDLVIMVQVTWSINQGFVAKLCWYGQYRLSADFRWGKSEFCAPLRAAAEGPTIIAITIKSWALSGTMHRTLSRYGAHNNILTFLSHLAGWKGKGTTFC